VKGTHVNWNWTVLRALAARGKASKVRHLRRSVTRGLVQGATREQIDNRLLTDKFYRIHILKERVSHIGSKSPLGKILPIKLVNILSKS
jgi:hypothetical protein